MMQLGGKKPHRKEKMERRVFNFSSGWWTHSRHTGIFEWSRFELFFKKMLLTVVTVQKQYQQKFVPGIKKWYYGTSVHFGNDFREHLEGPVIFFCLVCLFAKGCIISIHFVWSRSRKSVTESVGVGRGRQVWYRWGECPRWFDGVTDVTD
jgi:hypothetical protein